MIYYEEDNGYQIILVPDLNIKPATRLTMFDSGRKFRVSF